MKLYNKPELNVEKFDVEDVITATSPTLGDQDQNDHTFGGLQSAGMEFDIDVNGNEF